MHNKLLMCHWLCTVCQQGQGLLWIFSCNRHFLDHRWSTTHVKCDIITVDKGRRDWVGYNPWVYMCHIRPLTQEYNAQAQWRRVVNLGGGRSYQLKLSNELYVVTLDLILPENHLKWRPLTWECFQVPTSAHLWMSSQPFFSFQHVKRCRWRGSLWWQHYYRRKWVSPQLVALQPCKIHRNCTSKMRCMGFLLWRNFFAVAVCRMLELELLNA